MRFLVLCEKKSISNTGDQTGLSFELSIFLADWFSLKIIFFLGWVLVGEVFLLGGDWMVGEKGDNSTCIVY